MKSALIVIDVQNYYVNDQNEATGDLAEKVAEHIEQNGDSYDFILFTKFVNKPNSQFVKLLDWNKCTSPPDTDIHSKLSKFVNEGNVFEKTAFSMLASDKLVEFLEKNNVTKVFLCGTDTEACVYASAINAFDSGLDVKIILNLCSSANGKEAHEIGIRLLKDNLWGCLI